MKQTFIKVMKSIKEKAIEVFPRHCNANTDASNFKKRIGFNSGANYVLDEIEKLTNNQNWCAFPKQSHKELKELIEQLKK